MRSLTCLRLCHQNFPVLDASIGAIQSLIELEVTFCGLKGSLCSEQQAVGREKEVGL